MAGTVSIGSRTNTNLRFADDIDGLAAQEQELIKLVNHLEEASTACGMQISAEKTQLMINNTNGISADITIDIKKLETVRCFKYLGTIVSNDGSKPEVLSRIVQTTAAVTKLKVIWNDKNIAISSKIRLMCSLVMPICLYACETWTITADIERRIQTLEMRCFRKLLGISYRDHKSYEKVKARIRNVIRPYEDLLTSVKRRKLKWYRYVTRSSGLAKTILQATPTSADISQYQPTSADWGLAEGVGQSVLRSAEDRPGRGLSRSVATRDTPPAEAASETHGQFVHRGPPPWPCG